MRYVVDTISNFALTHGGVAHGSPDFIVGLPQGIFDCELVDGVLHVFDVVRMGNTDLRFTPLELRLALLDDAGLEVPRGPLDDILELALTTEGIVAKRPGSPYPMSKRTTDWLKWRWEWGSL